MCVISGPAQKRKNSSHQGKSQNINEDLLSVQPKKRNALCDVQNTPRLDVFVMSLLEEDLQTLWSNGVLAYEVFRLVPATITPLFQADSACFH
jgi:hypothetical protein